MPDESNEQAGDDFAAKLEGWRERLLDLGNRNPLINCRFSPRSNLVEFVVPSCEAVWRTLVADSDAGTSAMRLPWRRDLVPPPDEWQEFEVPPATPEPATAVAPSANESGVKNGEASQKQATEKQADANSDDAAEDTLPPTPERRQWTPTLDQCRQSPRLTKSDLLVDFTDATLDRKLRKLAGDAKLAMSEQGVQSLYATFGFLKWYESVDSGEQRMSPLILVPVTLSRETTGSPWELGESEDDALDNHSLRQRLWQDFRLELPPLPDLAELEEPGARMKYLDAVRDAIADNDRWTVEDRCAIGRFAFPKIAMWQDLGEHGPAVLQHPHCRILGGDEAGLRDDDLVAQAFGPIDDVPRSTELDDALSPGEMKTILDCDSSQLEAIVAARKGVSFVLDGPPGTGKSQTIANIIADSLSAGRTVLFVSEKIAALEVVKQRLEDRDLGDFCLECHSSKANRRSVLAELKRCLDLPAEVYRDTTYKLDELARQREQLNRYARSLHKPRPPLGFTPFELFGRICTLDAQGVQARSRCKIPHKTRTDRSHLDASLRLLRQAADHADLIASYHSHPWRGCKRSTRSLSLHDDARYHLKLLSERLHEFAGLIGPLGQSSSSSSKPSARSPLPEITIANLPSAVAACRRAASTPELPTEWFKKPASTANFVVRQLTAEAALESLRNKLAVLIDLDDLPAVTEATEKLVRKTAPNNTVPPIQGLDADLPAKLRDRVTGLKQQLDRILPVNEALQAVQAALSDCQSAAGFGFSPELRLDQVADVATALKAAADAGTARETWIRPEYQAKIEVLSERAIAIATKHQALIERLSVRVEHARLPELAAVVQDAEKSDPRLAERIVAVAATGAGTLDDVDSACREVAEAVERLTNLKLQRERLASVLQIEALESGKTFDPQDEPESHDALDPREGLDSLASPEPSGIPETVEPLVAIFSAIEAAGFVVGGVTDADDRAAFRTLCQEAISDLTEAETLETELGERMSHRAFRESSEPLAARGTEFTSLWKRWFGGYKKFRRDVADLYTARVPDASDLLDDLVLLDRFHRRRADVQAAATRRAPDLPIDFDATQVADWQRLAEALDAAEGLQTAWPGLFRRLPAKTLSVGARPLAATAREYLASVVQAGRPLDPSQLDTPPDSDDTAARLRRFKQRHADLEGVLALGRQCDHRMQRPLMSIAELSALLKSLALYRQRAANLTGGAERYPGWFPLDADATHAAPWRAMKSGVSAAKQFAALGVSPAKLAAAWCADRFETRREPWRKAAADLQAAHATLVNRLDRAGLRTDSRSLGEVRDAVESTLNSLTEQFAGASAVVDAIRDDCDPSFGELVALAGALVQFRHHKGELKNAQRRLKKLGVPAPQRSDLPAAQWMAQAVDNRRLDKIEKAVATDAAVRQRVRQVVDRAGEFDAPDFRNALEFLATLFDFDSGNDVHAAINATPLGELAERCGRWSGQTEALDDWIRFAGWRESLAEAGLEGVADELVDGRFPPEQAADVIAMQVYRELFDRLAEGDPHFGRFSVDHHERVQERFRQLDRWEIKAAASKIRQFQLGRDDRPAISFSSANSSELGILQREFAKKRKHKPLRKLFAEIPSVLQRIKPCVMMSPLSVSTLLHHEDLRFDLVIFDEASQVFPWDALGAVYRGRQLIVAGDEKQLPPTNFFSRQDADSQDDAKDDIGDYESILSLCKAVGMPSKRLKWHYRSRREPLIAFSNRHFYDGELVTFPSVDDGEGVHFEYVPEGRWVDRKNPIEAERVVQMIVRHVKTHPDKSLGIIAFNSTHQRAIEDTLYDLRRDRPDIDALFDGEDGFGSVDEKLFIKNLENVQGDERDVIFLSLGYGFNKVGSFNKNFGPINKQYGQRRLNVAVTRAREKLVLVASVRAAQMDLSGTQSEGAHLLKGYLSYAERGVDTLDLSMQEIAGKADSPFEQQVAAELIRRGLDPVAQVGCGGFRIDLALKHPQRPGEFCLAVECDGATYHSSNTARDRDRIRQSILENLGWSVVRIWSTDWVRNPERQIDRVLRAYHDAVASSPPHSDNSRTDSDASSGDEASTRVDTAGGEPADNADEDEDDDLEPTYLAQQVDPSRPPRMDFESIDEVPEDAIDTVATYLLTQAGAMNTDDLVRQTARQLGFRRTGQRIRKRIEAALKTGLERGDFKRSGDRIVIRPSQER